MSRTAAPALLLALVAAGLAVAGARRPAVAADVPLPPAVHASSTANSMVLADLGAIKAAMQKSRGRTLLVHFWASWCQPCLEELPIINRFAVEMKGRGVDVISVSLDDPNAAAKASQVLSEKGPNLTRHLAKIDDADAFIASFDRQWEGAIPAVFAFDAQGKLRGRHVGEATRRELERLLGDQGGKATAAGGSPARKK